MIYEGEVLNECRADFDFRFVEVLVVSGAGANICGHMILHAGNHYFHVAGGVRHRPLYMDEVGYQRYLKENAKQEYGRKTILVPKPGAALYEMEVLLANQWIWLGAAHNCVTFVEKILNAGGVQKDYWNCPVWNITSFDHENK